MKEYDSISGRNGNIDVAEGGRRLQFECCLYAVPFFTKARQSERMITFRVYRSLFKDQAFIIVVNEVLFCEVAGLAGGKIFEWDDGPIRLRYKRWVHASTFAILPFLLKIVNNDLNNHRSLVLTRSSC